ncbi:MAG TPA: hypothetical protein VF286_14275 [Acidiphilium sp.]
MNDVFERRRTQQGRQVVSYFPPEPWLELAGVYGQESFLILPHSMVTHELRRFQMFEGRQHGLLGAWGLDQLLNALRNGQTDRARQIDPI